jgi:hypothetical protein
MARIRAEAPYERERETDRQTQREIAKHKETAYKNIINSTTFQANFYINWNASGQTKWKNKMMQDLQEKRDDVL